MLEGRQMLEKYETLRTYEIHISQMLCQVSSGLSSPLQHLGCPDEAGFMPWRGNGRSQESLPLGE